MKGYYVILSRVQTWGIEAWQAALDCFQADGADTVILWIAGGFRSVRYPETWQYNGAHRNVEQDFVGTLIDDAHARGIRVLLGFTPFGYDGINQYPFRHPVTRGKNADGSPLAEGGMVCFGPSLCPAVPQSQAFMRDYIREMTEDFYPHADGLFIESTDYGRCECDVCREQYYTLEFAFVRDVSERFWKRRPDAPIVVYPHYFVEGTLDASHVQGKGAGCAFDPRWTLFFTRHSANPESPVYRELLSRVERKLFWDTSPIWGNPEQLRAGARTSRALGASYFPSFEGYAYHADRVEYDGDTFIVGHQCKPCGLEWLADGQHHYSDPLIRLNRLAYRLFSQNPDLDMDTFKQQVQGELFGPSASTDAVDTLFTLVDWVLADRQDSFFFASPLVIPERCYLKASVENWPEERLAAYHDKATHLAGIAERCARATEPVEREIGRIAAYIAEQWELVPLPATEKG